MDPEIEVTSAAKCPEIKVTLTSAAEDPDIKVRQGSSRRCTIFRAPAHIRYGRESDFEPKLVSIGPYHHGRENLQPMEVTKTRSMSDLLKMSVEGRSHIDRVPVDPFMMFGRRACSFYEEKFDHSDVDFVGMLVLDSCFIIRIMLSLCRDVPYIMAFLDVNVKEVRSDLLLLENQIPLYFIKEVYEWLFPNENIDNLPKFVVVLESFICLDLPWNVNVNDVLLESSEHLLDFYWRSSGPYKAQNKFGPVLLKWAFAAKKKIQQAQNNHSANNHSAPKFIANATELHQMAGIKFEKLPLTATVKLLKKKFEKLNSFGLQVKFLKGILWMPCLRIDSSHTTLFVNLIAYEKSVLPSIRIISTFIKFMDDLIDSKKDVELLQLSGVIYNTLSSHTQAATYFNDTGNFCSIDSDNNRFSQLFEDVEKYYKSSWNRRWASLQQNYFSTPWAGISVFAGVLLLFLSGVQTYYTVFPK